MLTHNNKVLQEVAHILNMPVSLLSSPAQGDPTGELVAVSGGWLELERHQENSLPPPAPSMLARKSVANLKAVDLDAANQEAEKRALEARAISVECLKQVLARGATTENGQFARRLGLLYDLIAK